jgi:hypothetical protein
VGLTMSEEEEDYYQVVADSLVPWELCDTTYWRTQDGRVMLVHEMDDDHLVNALRYFRRAEHALYAWVLIKGLVIESEEEHKLLQELVSALPREKFLRLLPLYRTMTAEVAKRYLMKQLANS